jgi:tartrate-resistant acid phosphatase type 5
MRKKGAELFCKEFNQLAFIIFILAGVHSFVQAQTVFAVVGDMGSDDSDEASVATMIDTWQPKFIFTVGDNVYTDSYTNDVGRYYHNYMYPHEPTYGSGDTTTFNHFWPTVGNHDWDYKNESSLDAYKSYFTLPNNEDYYTVQIGDIGFFVVDSDTREDDYGDGTDSNSAQAQWIHQQIQNSTAKWKIVLFHHPAYSSGYSGSTDYMQWPFEDWGIDAVLNGHDHDYERILKDDNNDGKKLVYIVDGLGGESNEDFDSPISGSVFRYGDNYGALKVIEKDDSLRFEFHSVDSGYPLLDSYTINKSVLPVELSSFTAEVVSASSIQLKWSTATEVNNYGFEVERKSGNTDWERIGFVAGSGNSNSPKNYSYTDNPTGGNSFSYRLKQIDVDGKYKYYDAITVNIGVSSEAQLLQNSPNPFNPSTAIKYYIPGATEVAIKIYDILGREVRTLINQQMTGGYHIVYWNGKDSRGEDVASGIYLYRLTAGSYSDTKKMNLLK